MAAVTEAQFKELEKKFEELKKINDSQENYLENLYNFNLKMLVDENYKDLISNYDEQIKKLAEKDKYSRDSGFDLFCPSDITIQPGEKVLYDLKVAFEPEFPGGYYLYPRSSFGKTPLRLCNSVGIIDNTYRGNVKALVENIGRYEVSFKKGERYFQLCHPSLIAMNVRIVDNISKTARGVGGYGSTGT